MTEPPFSRIGIVGLGLIGGSIALRARAAWPDTTIVGFDRPSGMAEAARRQIVDDTADDLADVADTDLIVLAVPVPVMLEVIPALARLETTAVVTDVGSTKRQVMAAAAAAGLAPFVGGHPMGGSERLGLDHSRADMFDARPWLLVTEGAETEACGRVERFVRELGAAPQWIDAGTHDHVMAYVSHLPQLVAVALMNAASEAIGEEGLSAAGRAFGEMTRLAASPPEMWQGILSGNSDFVAEAVVRFVARLPGGDELSDGRWVREAFSRAAAARLRAIDGDAEKR